MNAPTFQKKDLQALGKIGSVDFIDAVNSSKDDPESLQDFFRQLSVVTKTLRVDEQREFLNSLFSQARESLKEENSEMVICRETPIFSLRSLNQIAAAFKSAYSSDFSIDKGAFVAAISGCSEVISFASQDKDVQSLAQRSLSTLNPPAKLSHIRHSFPV